MQPTPNDRPGPKPKRQLDGFRGDFDAVADVVQRSWAENSQSLLYTAEFLRSALSAPGAGPHLAPAVYEGDQPIAFGAGFARTVAFGSARLNLVLSSFLSVTPEYKRFGLGAIVLGDLVRRAKAGGADGLIQFAIEGGPMHGMTIGLGDALSTPTRHVFAIDYLMRPLFPKPASPGPSDIERHMALLLELSAKVREVTPFARIWSEEDARWQCGERLGGVSESLERGPRRGLLTGHVMRVADGSQPKCLILEDVLWGDLESGERGELVDRMLERAVAAGARMAIVPRLGYADLAPFAAAKFRPSARKLHAYVSVWNGPEVIGPLPSMYIDVF